MPSHPETKTEDRDLIKELRNTLKNGQKDIGRINNQITQILSQKITERDFIETASFPKVSVLSDRVRTSSNDDQLLNAIIQVKHDYERYNYEFNRNIQLLQDKKDQIERVFICLTRLEINEYAAGKSGIHNAGVFLRELYVEGNESIEEWGSNNNYSRTSAFRIEREALQKLLDLVCSSLSTWQLQTTEPVNLKRT